MDLFKEDCHGKNEVSCQIKEYEVVEDEANEEAPGYFVFSYSFGKRMLSARGERLAAGTKKKGNVNKLVHEQYYIYSSFALVGNIGGTLGLLIGFSFSGSITWLLDMVIKVCQCYTKKKSICKKDATQH